MSGSESKKKERDHLDRQTIEPAPWVTDPRVRSLLREAKAQVNAWRYPNDHPYTRLIKCVEWLTKPRDDEN